MFLTSNSQYKVYLLLASSIVFIIGIFVYYNFIDKNDGGEDINKEDGIVFNEGGPEFDLVSLPALMEKEFNGRDLKLGQIQDGNSDYTRYHITTAIILNRTRTQTLKQMFVWGM